jgi:hypothetical protein
VVAGVRYLAAVASMDMRHTVDDGSGDPVCGGCATATCLLLESVELFGWTPGEDYSITFGIRQFVYWSYPGYGSDPCYVPTRYATWGAIKSMYR